MNTYQRRKLTANYGKDLLFVTSFAFCVITFEPIMIQTCLAHQNDHLNFSFVVDIKVLVEKMTRNGLKTATYYFASFLPYYCTVLLSSHFQYLLSGVRLFVSELLNEICAMTIQKDGALLAELPLKFPFIDLHKSLSHVMFYFLTKSSSQ